ncbi:MAG: hypothetical protein M1826_001103 [Phylliscum demangeonii]|nr:MAG: hypothetical protein M1826_001103 [Phylliscum demangeonii]
MHLLLALRALAAMATIFMILAPFSSASPMAAKPRIPRPPRTTRARKTPAAAAAAAAAPLEPAAEPLAAAAAVEAAAEAATAAGNELGLMTRSNFPFSDLLSLTAPTARFEAAADHCLMTSWSAWGAHREELDWVEIIQRCQSAFSTVPALPAEMEEGGFFQRFLNRAFNACQKLESEKPRRNSEGKKVRKKNCRKLYTIETRARSGSGATEKFQKWKPEHGAWGRQFQPARLVPGLKSAAHQVQGSLRGAVHLLGLDRPPQGWVAGVKKAGAAEEKWLRLPEF